MGAECGQGGNDHQERIHETVPEQELPACVRDVLDAARAARPESELNCIAFQTVESGHVTARLGRDMDVLGGRSIRDASSTVRAKDLLVLSVSVTETTFATVRTVTHVLVTLARRGIRSTPGIG